MSASDLPQATALLGGFVVTDRRGRFRQKYLKDGSPEELDARRALTRLLRRSGDLDRGLRETLAGLFDPDPPPGEQRKIKVVNRRRGKLTDHVAATQIFEEVTADIMARLGVNKAIANAAVRHATSDEMIKRIWNRYRAIYAPHVGRRRRK
jgi:hypothetical protein